MTNPPTETPKPNEPVHKPDSAGEHHVDHARGEHHVPVRYSRRSGLQIAVFTLVVAGVLIALYVIESRARGGKDAALALETSKEHDAPRRVAIVPVELGDPNQLLSLPAQCHPMVEATIYARTSGYLSTWTHDIGDHVGRGEVLANIDTPELEGQIAEARAKVAAQGAEVRLAQANLEFAKVSAGRYKAAAPDGVVSQQELDQKQAELQVTQARLESAKAQVTLAQAEVGRLEALADFKKVTSPFDGIITQRLIDTGSLITAGSTSSTSPLFKVASFEQMRVLVDVPQSAGTQIEIGMAATVVARELAGQKFVGHVERTSKAIDPASGTLKVEVIVPNKDLKLLPGMYVAIELKTRRGQAPFKIPASAMAFRANGPHVAVVSSEGRISFHPVKILRDMGDYIEVSEGISSQDRIALNISNDAVEGDRVVPALEAAPSLPQKAALPTEADLPRAQSPDTQRGQL